ncbi:hypothetical protein [Brachybacterium sp. GPGPB12]|uniref:hypothetical protein n=1 Tax=Brachybacterium sp. GPGPB12 TaxID=3023517 RepID=UPI00313452DE
MSRAASTRSATATRVPWAARTAVAERPDGVDGGIADDDIADGSVAEDSDADDSDVDGIAVCAADPACGGEGRGAGRSAAPGRRS